MLLQPRKRKAGTEVIVCISYRLLLQREQKHYFSGEEKSSYCTCHERLSAAEQQKFETSQVWLGRPGEDHRPLTEEQS